MVQTVVVREPGGPWVLEEARLPEPGAGQVHVRVDAVGLCRTDVSLAHGGLPTKFPLVPGHEGVGTVLTAGPGAGYSAGDRVVFVWTAPCGSCWYCARGEGALCERPPAEGRTPSVELSDGTLVVPGLGLGAFAEEIVASVASVRALPIPLPDAQAAVLGCAVSTGFGAVRSTAGVAAGESVVVIGAGGVGLCAIQTAKDVGAGPVIAVDPVAERRDLALKYGADLALEPGLTLPARVREVTDGRGADHVLECVGKSATIRQAWTLARRGGQVIVVGAGAKTDLVQFSALELFHSGKTLRGSVHGSFDVDSELGLLCERVAAGAYDLAGLVGEPMGLDRMPEALAALDAGSGGRSVFAPALTRARR